MIKFEKLYIKDENTWFDIETDGFCFKFKEKENVLFFNDEYIKTLFGDKYSLFNSKNEKLIKDCFYEHTLIDVPKATTCENV